MNLLHSHCSRGALAALTLTPVAVWALPWAGIVDPSRAVDWSRAGVPGGIPNRTSVCATLGTAGQAPTFVQSVTAAQISAALASCPANRVVLLNPGTYNLTDSIITSGVNDVTLRGAGADQTLLVFSGSSNCWGQNADVCFMATDGNWSGGPDNTASFVGAGPWPKGTTSIVLSDVTNLSVGGTLILDQVDDLSDDGRVYNCEQSATFSPNQNPPCNDDNGGTGGDSGAQRGTGTASVRGQQQLVTVTAINGSTVSFTPGLYMPNWRVFPDSRGSNVPGAWWVTAPARGMGIENLSIDHTQSSAFLGTQFYNCAGCWARGIRSIGSDRDHFAVYFSYGVTIRDSYMFGTKNSQSQSYGIEAFGTSDDLFENNIGQQVAVPFMINSDCEGCVASYGYSINDYYSASSNWMMQGVFLHSLTSNILLEGNVGSGAIADLFHGTHNFITLFRNRFDGNESNGGVATMGNTNPLKIYPFSRYFNVIGNVLGTAGYHDAYEYTISPEQGPGDTAILVAGTGPDTCCQAGDPLALSTMMLWGNYDTVNASTRFVSGEVPSALSQYANPVPASQALPPSFYLSAEPGWFGSVPWPPIGPDVAGGDVASVGGHANLNPAGLCYTQAMRGPADGTGAVLSFNADRCYLEATSGQDAGQPSDGGGTIDAGAPFDAGVRVDAGAFPDGGGAVDSGTRPDAAGGGAADGGTQGNASGGCGCGSGEATLALTGWALALVEVARRPRRARRRGGRWI